VLLTVASPRSLQKKDLTMHLLGFTDTSL